MHIEQGYNGVSQDSRYKVKNNGKGFGVVDTSGEFAGERRKFLRKRKINSTDYLGLGLLRWTRSIGIIVLALIFVILPPAE